MGDENAISQVANNILIIDKIIKFFNLSDLKLLRQINSLWNEVVSPKLFQKSVINLQTRQRSQKALECFVNTTKNMKHGIKELRIFADCFSSIELHEEESMLWNNILENISVHVEKLVFSPRNYFNRKTKYFIPRNDIKFPNVIKLDLRNDELDIVHIYPDFYSNFLNLKELIVLHLSEHGFGFVLSTLVNIEDGSRLCSLAPNLNSLTIIFNLSLNSLQLLVDFPQKWKKLDIELPNNLKDRSPVAAKLEQLLEQNKNTLICLRLRDHPNFNFKNVQKPSLQFPKVFPNLGELEIVFPELNYNIRPLSYCKVFPSLNTLFIRLAWISGENNDLLTTFFSKQLCQSLKILKIDVRLERLYSEILQNQGAERDWHLKMFPNAAVVSIR